MCFNLFYFLFVKVRIGGWTHALSVRLILQNLMALCLQSASYRHEPINAHNLKRAGYQCPCSPACFSFILYSRMVNCCSLWLFCLFDPVFSDPTDAAAAEDGRPTVLNGHVMHQATDLLTWIWHISASSSFFSF